MLLTRTILTSVSELCFYALRRGMNRRLGSGRPRSRRVQFSPATSPVEMFEARVLLDGVTVTQSGGSTDVTEGGETDSYTIVLDDAPSSNVVITVTPDNQTDLGKGAGVSIELTFTDKNWNQSQTVNVTAVDDKITEGPHESKITHSVSSKDKGYNKFKVADVVVNITDNDMAGVTITQSADSTDVTEGGETDTYTVVLDSQPISNVVVTVTPDGQSDLGSGAGVSVELTFTAGNWDTPQTITVAALDDAIAEGDHTSLISHTAVSTDPNYDEITIDDVTVNITDNDTAGVTITQSDDSTDVAEEGETSDTYDIVLDSQPTADVVITVTPDDQTDLGNGPGVAIELTFTPENWDTPQTVTVTAVDDLVAEKGHTGTITHTVASEDPTYDGMSVADVTVNITDNDTAGVTITQSDDSTDVAEEGETSDTYDIVLDSQPTADVVITVTPDDQTDLGNGPGVAIELTFTPENWDTPQTVTVTAVDDLIAEGSHTGTITHTVVSEDPFYDGRCVADVTVNITDNDTAALTVTIDDLAVTEGGSTTGTVTRNTPAVGDLVVNLVSSDTTEAKVVATVTILDGETSATFSVDAVDDSFVDGDRTVTITASADDFVDGSAEIDVIDNDKLGSGGDILLFDEASRRFKLGTNNGDSISWFQTNALPSNKGGWDSFVADFDGDGDLDGVVRNRDTNNVLLYTNNGDGTLTGPVLRGTAGTAGTPGFFQVGDYDGNGRSEILWLYLDGDYAGQVFTKDLVTTTVFNMVKANADYDAFITGDVNGDGFDDLIGLYDNDQGTRTNIIPFFSIESNNPNLPRRLRHLTNNAVIGQFGQSISVNGLGQFQVIDLDGDGRIDIVGVTTSGQVLHATASGNDTGDGDVFVNVKRYVASNRAPSFATANFPGPVLVGNFDDNLLGDVMSARNDGEIFVGRTSLNQAFLNPVVMSSPALNFGSGLDSVKYIVGDFNGDGYDDIAADIGGNAFVFLSNGDGNSFGAALDFGPIIGGGVGNMGAHGVG